MYGILTEWFGETAAAFITSLWFTLMIILIFYGAFEPNAGFRYLML